MIEDSQNHVALTLKVAQARLNLSFGFRVDFKVGLRPSFRMTSLQVLPQHDQRHQTDLDYVRQKPPQDKRRMRVKPERVGSHRVPAKPDHGPREEQQTKTIVPTRSVIQTASLSRLDNVFLCSTLAGRTGGRSFLSPWSASGDRSSRMVVISGGWSSISACEGRSVRAGRCRCTSTPGRGCEDARDDWQRHRHVISAEARNGCGGESCVGGRQSVFENQMCGSEGRARQRAVVSGRVSPWLARYRGICGTRPLRSGSPHVGHCHPSAIALP
jgi:hypothetical protein